MESIEILWMAAAPGIPEGWNVSWAWDTETDDVLVAAVGRHEGESVTVTMDTWGECPRIESSSGESGEGSALLAQALCSHVLRTQRAS